TFRRTHSARSSSPTWRSGARWCARAESRPSRSALCARPARSGVAQAAFSRGLGTATCVGRGNLGRFRGEPLDGHLKDDAAGIAVLLVIEAAVPLVFAAVRLDRVPGLLVVLHMEPDVVQPDVILGETFAGILVGLELDDGHVDRAVGKIDARGTDMVRIDLADLPHPERLHIEVRRLPRIRG